MRKRHKKRTRKYNLFNAMYTGYKRAFSNASKAGRLMQGERAMTKEDFFAAAIASGASYTDSEGVLRFDPARLRKMSAQAIATATGAFTSEQARRLKVKLIKLSKTGWKANSLAGRDISSVAVSELRNNKQLISDIYKELIRTGYSPSEADHEISGDIFGSP